MSDESVQTYLTWHGMALVREPCCVETFSKYIVRTMDKAGPKNITTSIGFTANGEVRKKHCDFIVAGNTTKQYELSGVVGFERRTVRWWTSNDTHAPEDTKHCLRRTRSGEWLLLIILAP